MVLGIKPEPKLANKRDQLKGVELGIRNSPNPFIKDLEAENGFLSNSLNSVELYLPPAVCEVLIPRFIQARRAGRLQNLTCFHMGSAIIHYTCIEIPLPKTCYLKMSDILVFLNEFSNLESFSTGDMETIDDCGENEAIYTTKPESIDNDLISASNQERYQEQKEYRLMKLEITPSSSRMFERLVSKMSRLTSLSLYFVGTINLLPAIQKHCQNLTSLALDMSAHYYPNDPIDDLNPDQEQKYKDWILLFKALPKLERFAGSSVSMPTVVLKTLATSCPNLKYFRACEDSILATSGVSFLLQNCLALKDLILEQHYNIDLFGGDQAWKAPLENLHFDVVKLFNEEENDCFRKRIYQLPKLKSLKIAYASKMSIRAILNPNDKDSEVVGEPLAQDLATPSDGRISHDIIAPNAPCPNLEILALGYFSEKSYEMFLKIVDSMPRLQSLIIGEQYSREAIMSARNRNK
ncbi:hypothetical protein BGZ49_007425 [Haplosporangium sp. Z 27]|nr:hypothetical protein BGZ49_007425 [Haplosporangium sp. Z 27]